MKRSLSAVFAVLTLVGCPTPAAPNDAAAAEQDAGTDGYSYVPPDAGPPGAALMPTDPCDDVAASLYETPPGLPPFSDDVRGTLLGCAMLETITAAELSTRLSGVSGALVTSGDIRVYLIAYRTAREPRDIEGVSTALVYLPEIAISERAPLVLATHGTVGLAGACAPSHLIHDPTSFLPASYLDALLLAWAARGLPVVAPDYAGLGTDGTHGYDNWLDPARSAIDGVRALRSMLPDARLDGRTLVYGHSQGGGVALSVAALAGEAPDVDLSAVVAFAPGYRTLSLVSAIRLRTVALTPILRGTAAMLLYSGLANLTPDATHWGDAIAPGIRDHVVSVVESQCYVPVLEDLDTPTADYVPPATVGDLVDADFSAAAIACADTGACDGLPGAWIARDAANEPHLTADSPPILVLGSTDDEAVTPGVLGCAIDRLMRDGAPPDLCITSGADHLGMVSALDTYGIEWALAASSGAERPPCTETETRAACRLF
jgi:pimeloyl-ACP methyl ester carboxylesterase